MSAETQESQQIRAMSTSAPKPLHPVEVIQAETELLISWNDGHRSAYQFSDLRQACPCALCRKVQRDLAAKGGPEVPLQVLSTAGPVTLIKVEQVGRYALKFHWSDGHQAGIYRYEYLRGLCPCGACASGEPA
jgi:DUF971 family protein